MKLNFWPFNCEDRRRAAAREALEEERVEERALAFKKEAGIKAGVRDAEAYRVRVGSDVALYRPEHVACDTCGGLFVPAKMKSVTHILVLAKEGTVLHTGQKRYCGVCHLGIDLEIELVGNSGGNLDTAHFAVGEGYLQPFDFQGEEQTLISIDDYARATCADCREIINTKTTARCPGCTKRRRGT